MATQVRSCPKCFQLMWLKSSEYELLDEETVRAKWAHCGPAVRAFCAHRFFIEQFVLAGLQPHELEALGAATDLRCHVFPRTLGHAGRCIRPPGLQKGSERGPGFPPGAYSSTRCPPPSRLPLRFPKRRKWKLRSS